MKAKLNVNTLNKMLKAANKFVDKKSIGAVVMPMEW